MGKKVNRRGPAFLPKAFGSRPQRAVDLMTSREFRVDSSAHIEAAAQRLQDKVSIQTFKDVILQNRHLFRGRTVLDIGCGLGILSLLAAKAGAARVYAVDNSNILDYTREIISDNGFKDIIHVIKGSLETVELPDDANVVDVIVCDWIGYSLLFESTCDAVIYARDKWLRKDGNGVIFPDVAKIFIAGLRDIRHKNQRIEWWRDVYGFDMKCMRQCAVAEPVFMKVKPDQLVTTSFHVKSINLYTATIKDLCFRSMFTLRTVNAGIMDGIVTYFNVYFSKSHTPKHIATDPMSPITRWLHSVFFFDQSIHIAEKRKFFGGIEMYSKAAAGACDLNNMVVGFEMFSGDPSISNLEVEMCWNLKARVTSNIGPRFTTVKKQSELATPNVANTIQIPVKAQAKSDKTHRNSHNAQPKQREQSVVPVKKPGNFDKSQKLPSGFIAIKKGRCRHTKL